MKDKDIVRILLKIEMKMALDEFKKSYKKVSKGIEKMYTEANLSNDSEEIKKLHTRFFGYLQKSKNAKEKWND